MIDSSMYNVHCILGIIINKSIIIKDNYRVNSISNKQ